MGHILTAQVVMRHNPPPPQREIKQSNGCHSCLGHSVILRHNKNEAKMCLWILADLIRWKMSAGRGRRGRRSRLPSPRRPSSGSPPNHSRATPRVTRERLEEEGTPNRPGDESVKSLPFAPEPKNILLLNIWITWPTQKPDGPWTPRTLDWMVI